MMPSLYICVFILIAILATITIIRPDTDKKLYYIGFTVMTLFLALRYGQGTDYGGYLEIYHQAGDAFDPAYGLKFYLENTHTEIGWQMLMLFLRFAKIDFQIFVVILSFVMMYLTHRFIGQYCTQYETAALVLLYPTIYLTFYFSALRQGLVIALFFGVLLKKLLDKKYIHYVIGVVLLCTIHTSAFVYFAAPIMMLLDKKKIKYVFVLCILFSVAMLWEPTRDLIQTIATAFGAGRGYFKSPAISWFSLAERCVMFGIILVLWWKRDDQFENDDKIKPLLRIYCLALMIYICLMINSTLSSRLAIMFKMAEVALIPMLLSRTERKLKGAVFAFVLLISAVMSYKNIDYYSEGYFQEVNGWNYPYITIFNQEDSLLYRNESIEKYNDRPYDFYESDYMWH